MRHKKSDKRERGTVDVPRGKDGKFRILHHDAGIRKPAAFHLPEVCRQIYAETVLTSHKANTFICYTHFVTRTNPMARLMAAQRRAIAILEPGPWRFEYMVRNTDRGLTGITRVWPDIHRVVITPEAMQNLQNVQSRGRSTQPPESATWNQKY
jgi:hypothetical protein